MVSITFRLSAQDNNLDFAATVADAVRMLSATDCAVAHSAARASLLREVIRCRTADTSSEVWPAVNLTERAALVQTVIASTDEVIRNEYQAVLSRLPASTTARMEGDSMSVWGAPLLSAAYLDAVETFGKPCSDPGNFQSSLLAILTATSYSEGIQRNILAGGCNCSRSNFIGAVLGAAYGLGEANGVPLEWLRRTDQGLETLELALGLFREV